MHWEMMTPYYATGLLLVLSFHSRGTLMTPKRIIEALTSIGKLITQSVAIILPVGFVISGLTVTGVGASFTAGLVSLGEGNVFLILIMGVVACYIMGMAGMVIAAYIFLAELKITAGFDFFYKSPVFCLHFRESLQKLCAV